MKIEPIDWGLLDRQNPSIGACSIDRWLDQRAHFFIQHQTMNSPAPNIPCAVSATSPFTEYMKELELEATSEDDSCA
jgi:hypothetical protein